jgi:hypothetical protein
MQSLCNQSVTSKMSWLVGRVTGVMINAPGTKLGTEEQQVSQTTTKGLFFCSASGLHFFDGIGLRAADRPSRRSGRHRHLIDGPGGHQAA